MSRRTGVAVVARLSTLFQWLKARSVWKLRDDVTDPDQTQRLWLPLFDLAMFIAGLIAVVFGSPILHRLFPYALVDVAGIGLMIGAISAGVGVSFPRLGLLELGGKFTIIFFMSCYTTCVAFFPADPGFGNWFLVVLLIALLFMIYPRVRRLLRDSHVRKDWSRLVRFGRS